MEAGRGKGRRAATGASQEGEGGAAAAGEGPGQPPRPDPASASPPRRLQSGGGRAAAPRISHYARCCKMWAWGRHQRPRRAPSGLRSPCTIARQHSAVARTREAAILLLPAGLLKPDGCPLLPRATDTDLNGVRARPRQRGDAGSDRRPPGRRMAPQLHHSSAPRSRESLVVCGSGSQPPTTGQGHGTMKRGAASAGLTPRTAGEVLGGGGSRCLGRHLTMWHMCGLMGRADIWNGMCAIQAS